MTAAANRVDFPGRKVRVVVADDSPTVRARLAEVIGADPAMEVVAMVATGREAVRVTLRLLPDLVTMDLHMPDLDGVGATREIMRLAPTPIAVVTAVPNAAEAALGCAAIAAGAVDVIEKPNGELLRADPAAREVFNRRLRAMAGVRVVGRRRTASPTARPERRPATSRPRTTPPAQRGPEAAAAGHGGTPWTSLLVIGASTGGPPALKTVLAGLRPELAPPTLLVQHMAAGFLEGFAQWLGEDLALPVRLARHGDALVPGVVLLAPGDRHLEVRPDGRLALVEGSAGEHHCPAVDRLFASVARSAGPGAVGVLLTGMGADGAEGLGAMRRAGALTVAQDEATSRVYGMPKVARDLGAAAFVEPLDLIALRLGRLRAFTRSGASRWKRTP